MSDKEWVFEKLVASETDAIGLLAYALYKHEKHELACKLRKSGASEGDIDSQVSTFHNQALIPARLFGYKAQSSKFIDTLTASATDKKDGEISTIKNNHEKQKKKDILNAQRAFVSKVNKVHVESQNIWQRLYIWAFSAVPGAIGSAILLVLMLGLLVVFAPSEFKKNLINTIVEQLVENPDIPVPGS